MRSSVVDVLLDILTSRLKNILVSHVFRATKDSPSREFARPRPCAASLPCVDAASRHELMLVRMRDIIANGIDPPKDVSGDRLTV